MGQCMPKRDISFVSPLKLETFASYPSQEDAQEIPLSYGRDPEGSRKYIGKEKVSSINMSTLSAPSAINNDRLTTIYQIPNERFNTVQDVFNARRIRLLSKIDEGGFAKVHLAMIEDRKVACKIIDIDNVFSNDIDPTNNRKLIDVKNELFVLQKIKHPHIIRLHVHFIINDHLYIFMHYANSGNLFQFMQLHGPMLETKARQPFSQIISGVAFMHAKCIAHRDLKLSNILLNANQAGKLQILITDFGLSRVVYRARKGVLLCKSYCGTPNYMAPELKRRQSYDAFAIDIYALGVILFLMLNCSYPFDVQEDSKALAAMEQTIPTLAWNPNTKVSNQLQTLFNRMLHPNVSKRITMPELLKVDWYQSEMARLKYCLPPLEEFERQKQHSEHSLRRLSSPAEDIRLDRHSKQPHLSNQPKYSPLLSSFHYNKCHKSKHSKESLKQNIKKILPSPPKHCLDSRKLENIGDLIKIMENKNQNLKTKVLIKKSLKK